jgi:hypothetical protein
MTDRLNVKFGNMQKTPFFPLWGRAAESKKRNPLRSMKPQSKLSNRWIMTFRKWHRVSTN